MRATFLIAARVGHRHCITLDCVQQLCIRRAIAKKNRNVVRRGLFRSQAIQRQPRQLARRWDSVVPQMGRELAHERQALTIVAKEHFSLVPVSLGSRSDKWCAIEPRGEGLAALSGVKVERRG